MTGPNSIVPRDFICVNCGSIFQAKRDAMYCSSACRNKARKPRTYDPEYRAARYKAHTADPERKAKMNEKARERSRKVKEWINAYKVERGCIDCGYNKHPVGLDIDHMDGKTHNVANLKSIKAVQEEIARHDCVVRCATCHRVKSFETKTWVRP